MKPQECPHARHVTGIGATLRILSAHAENAVDLDIFLTSDQLTHTQQAEGLALVERLHELSADFDAWLEKDA